MNKILLPFLLACSLNSFSQTYNAGTIFTAYKDINPDTLLNYIYYPYTNETYGIDLFDDPSPDIEFAAHGAVSSGGSSAYINVAVLNTNVFLRFGRLDSVYVTGSSYWNVTQIAKPLNMGEPINPSGAQWNNSMLYLTDHSGQSGGNKDVNDWIGGDKYLGIKYDNGTNVTYGWVRVQCATKDSCYIKDQSHTPSGLGTHDLDEPNVQVYPNPTTATFFLKSENAGLLDAQDFKLKNVYGQSVEFKCERQGGTIKIDPAPGLPHGCYFVQYSKNGQLFSKKLVRLVE